MPESARKPEVLFITRKWRPAVGGMERYSEELTDALDGHCSITLRALPGRSGGRPPASHRLVAFGISTALMLVRNATRFDVVHFGDLAIWPLAFVSQLRSRTARLVISAHGTDIAYPRRSGIGPRLYGLYLSVGARLCRRLEVIANSAATAALCESRGFRVAAVVPLAVRVPPPPPVPDVPKPYILFVGRLVRRKGCGWFIREVLPQLSPPLTLLIAGTEWDKEESESLRSRHVTFLGPVFGRELSRLRREALVVIMPNVSCDGRDFEGFGLTAVETAADQGVLLASRIDGIVDAVADGVTGFLLPPEDAAAWCERIREIAAWAPETRRVFVAGALDRVRQDYAWSRVAAATLAVYSSAPAA